MTIENRSGIWPTNYCILIKQNKAPRKKGSLLMPETALDRMDGAITRGVIVAASPLAFDFAQWPDGGAGYERKPRVGDHVHFKKFSYAELEGADGETYWMIQDKELQGLLDPAAFGFEEEARNAA